MFVYTFNNVLLLLQWFPNLFEPLSETEALLQTKGTL